MVAPVGCDCLIERVLIYAPNRGVESMTGQAPLPDLPCREIRVEVGPPRAVLSTWVIDPARPDGPSPRGTILLLHGFWRQKSSLIRLARVLHLQGYRVCLVDLRGQGWSTGDWLTYGVKESEDLSQVLDALEAGGLAASPVGVFGISYGAAVSIQFAARDRRVGAVVAVAGFSSLREVVPRYVRLCLPVFGWLMSDRQIQAAIDHAASHAGFDPDAASAARAMARVEVPVLLIHGREDFLIPPTHSQALLRAGKRETTLLLLENEGHNSLFADAHGAVALASSEWFARWLVPASPPGPNRGAP